MKMEGESEIFDYVIFHGNTIYTKLFIQYR